MEKVILNTKSTVGAVSDMLEEDIYSLHYTMGEKIKETDLAYRYNVSRNTVRESLVYLASKGLVEKVANKGIYVKMISANDIDEIFHLRELLEAEAIREIIAAGSVPQKLHDLADNVSIHKPDTDTIANLTADIAFHKFLVESSGSPRLVNMYEGLLSEVKLCVFQAQAFVPARPENIIHHFNLIQAMEESDLHKALTYLSEHIESAIKSYKKGLLNRQNGKAG